MAKSSKSKAGKSKTEQSVDDATVASSTEGVTPFVLESEVEATDVDAMQMTNERIGEDDLDEKPRADLDDERADFDLEVIEDTIEESAVDRDTLDSFTPASGERKPLAGFVPLLFGGVVAGAIGYGIATYFPLNNGSDDFATQMSAQSDQIEDLEMRLEEIPIVNLSGVEAQVAEVSEQANIQIEGLSANVVAGLAALDARLLEVEKRPSGDGTLSATALAAYQRELEQLRMELDAQKEDVMSVAAQAEADLAAARAEAEVLEQEAIASAENAAARAALNRIATAVETGAPFADAISDLMAQNLPAALTDAAEAGVATTAQLTSDFSSAARAALATARSEGVSDDAAGLGGFLRSQFDVRSTSPQEGSGPDAVLSRADAAIKEGRVADALAEIQALPEVARAELTDWTARAQERADVLNAIATLSETYN